MMEIRECNGCDWVGWADDCVHPKHVKSLSLCPECKETTFTVKPERVIELREMIQKACGDYQVLLDSYPQINYYFSILRYYPLKHPFPA